MTTIDGESVTGLKRTVTIEHSSTKPGWAKVTIKLKAKNEHAYTVLVPLAALKQVLKGL